MGVGIEDTAGFDIPDPFELEAQDAAKPVDQRTYTDRLGDKGRMLQSGAYGVVGSVGGAIDYLTDQKPGAFTRWGKSGAKEAFEKMSPEAQKAASAAFLSDDEGADIWDKDISMMEAIGLKVIGSLPSIAASVGAGIVGGGGAAAVGLGAAARGAASFVAGSGAGAAMSSGDVFNEISERITGVADDKLQEISPIYGALRAEGLDEATAKKYLLAETASYKPLLVGMVTGLTSRFGIEGALAKRVAGDVVTRSIMRGIGLGTLGEASQESIESTFGEAMKQLAGSEISGMDERDLGKLANTAVEGFVIGGITGGAMGGVIEATKPKRQGADQDAAKSALAPNPVDQTTAPAPTSDPNALVIKVKPKPKAIPTAKTAPNEQVDEALANGQPTAGNAPTGITPDTAPNDTVQEQLDAPSNAQTRSEPAVAGSTAPVPGTADAAEAAAGDRPSPGNRAPAVDPAVESVLKDPNSPVTDEWDTREGTDLPNYDPELGEDPNTVLDPDAPRPPALGPTPLPPILQDNPPPSTPVEQPVAASSTVADPVSEAGVPDDMPVAPAPPQPSGPRVLIDDSQLTEEEKAKQWAAEPPPVKRPRFTTLQANDVIEGRGEVTTLDPDQSKWGDKNDARYLNTVGTTLAKAAQAAGKPLDPDWQAVVTLKGKVPPDVRARLQERSDKGTRIAGKAATTERNRVKRTAAQISAERSLKKVFDQTPTPLEEGGVKPYIQRLLAKAKELNIKIPDVVTDETSEGVALLAMAKSLQRSNDKTKLRDYIATDLQVRAGATGVVREYRAAEAAKSNPSFNPEIRGTARDDLNDRDAGEIYDASRVEDVISETVSDSTAEVITGEAEANPDTAVIENKRPDEGEGRAEIEAKPKGPVAVEKRTTRKLPSAAERAALLSKERAPKAPEKPRGVIGKLLGKPPTAAEKLAAISKARSKPVVVTKASDMAEARAKVNTDPTEAQKIAGNYAKGRVVVGGLPATIETPKGVNRTGVDKDGQPWSVKQPHDYGSIPGTKGADGEQIDIYVGPNPASKLVYVVDQYDGTTGKFDEHKVFVGFNSMGAVQEAYAKAYPDGVMRPGAFTMLSVDGFRAWAAKPRRGPLGPVRSEAMMKVVRDQKPAKTEEQANSQLLDVRSLEDAQSQVNELGGADRIREAAQRRKAMTVPGDRGQKTVQAVRRTTLAEALAAINPKRIDGLGAKLLRQFRPIMDELASSTPVFVVTEEQMATLVGRNVDIPAGYWHRGEEVLVIREDKLASPDDAARVLVHEGSHAALQQALDSSPQLLARVEALRQAVIADLERRGIPTAPVDTLYGLKDAHEFIAEVMSNPDFMQILAGIQVPANVRQAMGLPAMIANGVRTFIDMVRKHFGLDSTSMSVLEAGLRTVDDLVELSRSQSPGLTITPQGNSDILALIPMKVQDKAKGFNLGLRRFGIRAGSFDQLRQQFDGLMGGAIGRVQEAMQRQRMEAQKEFEKGLELTQEFTELARTDRKTADAAQELMQDITTADVNVVQPGQNVIAANRHHFDKNGNPKVGSIQSATLLPQLQKDFEALPQAFRDHIIKASTYYRAHQNEMVRLSVGNILRDAITSGLVKLTDPQAQAIANKVVTGRLDQADKTAIGDQGIIDAISNVTKFRVRNGMYFPLMRFGDFVVTTTEGIGNTMGGRVVDADNGVVEFRAPDDKTARAQYEAFAKQSKLRVNGIGKVFYDRVTGKKMKALDAKAHTGPIDVAYVVRVQTKGVYFFEAASEAEQFIRENHDEIVTKGGGKIAPNAMDRVEYENGNHGMTDAQLEAVLKRIKGMPGLPPAVATITETAYRQASIALMTGNRVAHRSLPRRNVRGASHDHARVMAQYARSASNQIAKMRYIGDIRADMARMDAMTKNTYDKDHAARGQVLRELTLRVNENTVETNDPSRAVQDIMILSYLDKLFSPAYSVINGMQPWMVTAPILGAKFGNARAGLAMTKAYFTVAGPMAIKSGIANTGRAFRVDKTSLNLTDLAGDMQARIAKDKQFGKEMASLFQEMLDRGVIDRNAGMEIAQAVGNGRGRWGTGLARVDRIARQLPAAVEAVNRAVTLVASYKLARNSGMTDAQARAYAYDTIQNTQGDYSGINAPRFFNNPILRPALQFKKYAQMMLYLMHQMLSKSFGRNSTMKERREGLKQIGNIVMVQIAMAGVMGLPGLELIKIIAMAGSMLGIGGGYEDLERKARGVFDDAFGKRWGELLSKGVLSRAANIDLSTRVSLADMLTFGEPKGGGKENIQAYLAQLFMGAPGGMLIEWITAAQDIGNGDYLKGISKMVPAKFIADSVSATLKYKNSDIGGGTALLNATGLRTGTQAEEGDQIGANIAKRDKILEEGKKLRKAYMDATTTAERVKALSRIRTFNKTAPLRAKVLGVEKQWKEREEKRALNR